MKTFGYHSKIKLNDREFHIHTGSIVEKSLILSEIFESGKFITSREFDFEVRNDDQDESQQEYLKNIAGKLHKETLEEINMLFYVHSKIRLLKQYMPHFKLASVFYDRNFIPEAIENFKRAIELKNDFVPAYVRLGRAYILNGQYDEAVAVLEKSYEMRPDFPDIANTLGVALTLTRNYDRASQVLQQAIEKNPGFDEANFNLGVVLFRSTIEGGEADENVVLPQRVIRYVKALRNLERYSESEWQDIFERTLAILHDGNRDDVLTALEELQLKLVGHLKINSVVESFYLKFMYGGRELDREELEIYEKRINEQAPERSQFADYWNELGTIHMIQCRNLFLKSMAEFEKAVKLNKNYTDASRNLELIKNNKKGFLILLRAILK